MKKIIVFGASGDTGTYFVKYFLDHYTENNFELIAVGTRKTDKFEKMGVTYYEVDITKKEEFEKTSQRCLCSSKSCRGDAGSNGRV